ncbi:uncharacterized protein LOC122923298, partial [Bufo gargarizans]|uniref:uncharacterized protein LOC122923298 n=1 Tax=Bufo gargarizans TaxID=30331 RepID=UPI001CF3AA90
MDNYPKVSLEGRNVPSVASPSAAGSKEEKKMLEVKKETSLSKSMAAGVQSTPPAGRQRRTSLEKQTMQENLQQSVLMRSDRTRYGGGNRAKVANTTDETRGSTAGRLHGATSAVTGKNQGPSHQSGDSDLAAVTTAAPSPVQGPSRGTPVRSHSVSTLPTQPPNTQRAPELSLAERIPALVKRLETLKKTKLQLQKQIDCVYKLKAANPNNQAVHDKKLSSLAVQLADTVQDMEAVLEQMGPVAESFRNQQRHEERPAPEPSPSKPRSLTCPDDTQQACARPVLRPASFPFEKGNLYREVEESVQHQQRPAETPQKVPQVPAVCTVKQDYGLQPEGNSAVAVQSPQALGGSRERQDCGLSPEGNSAVAVQSPQVLGGSREQQDCGLSPEGSSAAESSQVMAQQDCRGSVQQDHTASDCIDMTACDVTDDVSAEGSASQSVWDLGSSLDSGPPLGQPSEACDPQSIKDDGGEGAVQSDAQHFPPLVTPEVSDPHSAGGQQPPQRPQVQQEGGTGGVSSGNAWSRGSPSFTSNVNYTGQAFKRRNVVRFRHRGAKEELPDRRFVVRELLCHQMGFLPSNILTDR